MWPCTQEQGSRGCTFRGMVSLWSISSSMSHLIYLFAKAMRLRCDCTNQTPLCTDSVGNGTDPSSSAVMKVMLHSKEQKMHFLSNNSQWHSWQASQFCSARKMAARCKWLHGVTSLQLIHRHCNCKPGTSLLSLAKGCGFTQSYTLAWLPQSALGCRSCVRVNHCCKQSDAES